jgi:DNA transposition AAA+ family ATPase
MADIVKLSEAEAEAKPAFCPELQTTQDILRVLRVCQDQGEFGIIVGAAGTGKSETSKYYVSLAHDAHLITNVYSKSGLVPFLENIAQSIRVYTPNTGAASLFDAIVHELRHKFRKTLLILDEAHHLSDMSLEEARSIRDATGIGMVIAGNPSLLDRWSNKPASRRAYWAQFLSRVGPMLTIPAPLPQDVDRLCDHLGNVTAAARKLIKKHVMGPGALRDVSKLVEIGAALAKGGPIKPAHIEDAILVRGDRP